jgi:hypothetical protein
MVRLTVDGLQEGAVHVAVNPDHVVRLREFLIGSWVYTRVHMSDGFSFDVKQPMSNISGSLDEDRRKR